MRRIAILSAIKLLSLLPMSVAHGLGSVLGTLFYWIPNRERRNARINIALCFPQLGERERATLLRRSLVENAKTLTETPAIWRGRRAYWLSRIRVGQGREVLDQLLSLGKGVIVAAPHLGNWEVGAHYLPRVAPTTALYRPPRERALEQVMLQGRSSGGARLVATDASGIKALYRALQQGELVAILPDQEPKSADTGAGVFAPFFDEPALTMVLVSRLARRSGAPVVFSFAERLAHGRGYQAHWIAAPEGIADADTVVAATALNQGVEACVRRCPEQYQWSYKRFKLRPGGGGAKRYTGPR